MERRQALVVAGTLTATLAMAGTAMAVNLGLLGADSDPVGDLTPAEVQPTAQRGNGQDPEVRVIVQDIPVPAGTGSAGGSSSGGATVESAPDPAPAPIVDDSDDDGYDDHDEYEDEDHDEYEDDDD